MLWLASHWSWLAGGGVLALLLAFPGAAQLVFATRAGRALVAVALVAGAIAWLWTARYAEGYRAAQADHEKAALVAQGAARMTERNQAIRLAVIAERYEQEKRDGAQAAYDRALADVRSGRVRLRGPWACPVPGADATAAERDAAARLREEAASRVVRIGAEADARLRACQALVREYTGTYPQPETPQ
jgi:hypothetical protein